MTSVSRRSKANRKLRTAIDAVAYAAVTTLLSFLIAAVVGTIAPMPFWFGVEVVLFLIGWFLFGYATVLAWPASKRRSQTPLGRLAALDDSDDPGHGEGPFSSAVADGLPDRWSVPPRERLGRWAKLYLAALTVLVTSVLVERLLVV